MLKGEKVEIMERGQYRLYTPDSLGVDMRRLTDSQEWWESCNNHTIGMVPLLTSLRFWSIYLVCCIYIQHLCFMKILKQGFSVLLPFWPRILHCGVVLCIADMVSSISGLYPPVVTIINFWGPYQMAPGAILVCNHLHLRMNALK